MYTRYHILPINKYILSSYNNMLGHLCSKTIHNKY